VVVSQLVLLECIVLGMVFNATFNNISAILWRFVVLVEESGVPRESRRPAASKSLTNVIA
jgi:hypothetical protein